MLKTIRTNSQDLDFVHLVAQLDKLLAVLDGREHDFYDQFNKINKIKHVIVAHQDGVPVACGAIKEYDLNTIEVKRMFTIDQFRGKGIATTVLEELEQWAKELGYSRSILETGKRLPDAVRLYQKNGYRQIPNFGQYVQMENSICFEKEIMK